jgi:ubiquinone/menaquinone biosynthesis C-methylase UbiE
LNYARKVQSFFEDQKNIKYDRQYITDPIKSFQDELDLLSQYEQKIRNFLDVGCGFPHFLNAIKKTLKIKQLYGIDISRRTIKLCNQTIKNNIFFCLGDAKRLPFKTNSFDCISMYTILHHIVGKNRTKSKENAINAILETKRLLKHGGFLLLTEPYYESIGVKTLTSNILFNFLSLFTNFKITSLLLKEAPQGLIISFYTRSELRKMIRSNGGIIVHESIKTWKIGFKEKIALLHKRGKIRFLIQYTN